MDNLELYKERIRSSGRIPRKRQEANKVATFKNALDRSYNSEEIIKDENRIRALISGIPTHPQIERKNFSTLLEHNCEIGDEVFWERDNSYWIITSHDSTERAVFQGFIEKALYKIKWKDPETGIVYETRACAKGPDQIIISDGVKHSIFYDESTDSLHLIVSAKVPGIDLLERYGYLMVEGRKWHIEVADSITKENLVILELLEEPINQHEDTEDLVGGKKELKLEVYSILDKIKSVKLGEAIDFNPRLYRNGNLVEDPIVEIEVNGTKLVGTEIKFDEEGTFNILVNYPEYPNTNVIGGSWEIEVEEDVKTSEAVVGHILGDETVFTMMDAKFELQATTKIKGEWKYDPDFFEGDGAANGNKIALTAKNNTGRTTLEFYFEDEDKEPLKKSIRIIPLFGGGG